MKSLKIITGLLVIFVTAPIWYYLLHWVLIASNAGDLQMFLFWVYVPFAFFIAIVGSIANSMKSGK
jgi:hypothetical protein